VAPSFIPNQILDIANWQHIQDMPAGAIVAPVRRMTSLSGAEMKRRPSQIYLQAKIQSSFQKTKSAAPLIVSTFHLYTGVMF
jgi:hypothetical protein